MRNFFFLLALSFPISIFAQQSNYPITELEPAELIVTYSLKFQQDSTNPNFIRQEDMLLFVGQNISKFTSNNAYTSDTITRKVSSRAEYQKLLSDLNNPLPHSAFFYQIFKKYQKEKLMCLEHTLDGTFKYEEKLNLFNWQLTGDTATISGYKAQKALCSFSGRDWIAWFSPELPFNDGPYKFNGLPGLILKISDTQNHYVFDFISIEKPTEQLMIDFKKKDFIESTKQVLFRAKDAFRADIINRAKAAGLPSKAQQNAARNMAGRNNPIELKRK